METGRFGRVGLLAVAVAALVGTPATGGESAKALRILQPVEGQISQVGPMPVLIRLPKKAVPGTVTLELDGQDVTGLFEVGPRHALGVLPELPEGPHALHVSVLAGKQQRVETVHASASFEAVALQNPDQCEVLNDAECLLPYPSSRFLARTGGGPNRRRLAFPAIGMPSQLGIPAPPEPYAVRDGFSPTVQILMHFPAGVDLEASDAPRLLAEPNRSTDLTSLSIAQSPSLLIDAKSRQPMLHWLENDARAADDPGRRVLFMRPGRSLTPGHRYIVAMRDTLVDEAGDPIQPEVAFRALRDRIPTDIPGIESRRRHFEKLFKRLKRLGIPREELVLAFDFRVASDKNLTRQMISMRDQAFAWLKRIDQSDPAQRTFTVDSTSVSDCSEPGTTVWKVVRGTFQVPLFLDSDPETDPIPPGFLRVRRNGFTPVFDGFTHPPYAIAIPCAVLDGGAEVHSVVFGHGLFGNGPDDVAEIGSLAGFIEEFGLGSFDYIVGGTNWRGLSDPDFDGIAKPSFILDSVLLTLGENFSALPDRLRQGQLNTVVLARMMKRALFNAHEAFHTPDGRGALPPPEREMYYVGASLGGIMGLMFAAVSPDVVRASVDVPGINFSMLIQRATPFRQFQVLLTATVSPDPMIQALGIGLLHELWVTGEPAGYATHITDHPLRKTNAKEILMTMAFLDHQVTNQGTEIAARTLGLSNLEGSLLDGLPEIPDRSGPLSSALVIYDTGSLDLGIPEHAPFIPPLENRPPPKDTICDPHGRRFAIPASVEQLLNFLRPGGAVENFCDGRCDVDPSVVDFTPSGVAFRPEIPGGEDAPCDPLNPTPLP